ncbi:hypothetical protein PGB90_000748 [Kerria lacca]
MIKSPYTSVSVLIMATLYNNCRSTIYDYKIWELFLQGEQQHSHTPLNLAHLLL